MTRPIAIMNVAFATCKVIPCFIAYQNRNRIALAAVVVKPTWRDNGESRESDANSNGFGNALASKARCIHLAYLSKCAASGLPGPGAVMRKCEGLVRCVRNCQFI